jgi:hypothetical protein
MIDNLRRTDDLRTSDNPKLTYNQPVVPGQHFIGGAAQNPGEVRKYKPDTFYIDETGERFGAAGQEGFHLSPLPLAYERFFSRRLLRLLRLGWGRFLLPGHFSGRHFCPRLRLPRKSPINLSLYQAVINLLHPNRLFILDQHRLSLSREIWEHSLQWIQAKRREQNGLICAGLLFPAFDYLISEPFQP